MKKLYVMLSLIALMLLVTPPVGSAMRIGETNPLADITVQDSRLAWEISNEYHLAVETGQISFLRNQDFSYAEIVALYGLADASNKPFSTILQMRQGDNLEWYEILVRLNLNSADITTRGSTILNNMHLAEDAKIISQLFVDNNMNQDAVASVAKSKKPNKTPISQNSTYNSSGKTRF